MFFYLEIVIIIKEINYEKTTGTYIFLFKNSYHNKKTSTVTSVTELNILNYYSGVCSYNAFASFYISVSSC